MDNSQKGEGHPDRRRRGERGLARFEMLGREADCDLIRSVARLLAEDGPEASQLRAVMSQSISGEPPRTGGIVASLRRSALVCADLDVRRPREEGRDVAI
jgi:hypothetical protein